MLLQVSIPAWFTVDSRLGSLSVHLDTPQCFSAEMYGIDLNMPGASEDHKVDSPYFSLNFFLFKMNSKFSNSPSGSILLIQNSPICRPGAHLPLLRQSPDKCQIGLLGVFFFLVDVECAYT